MGNFSARRGLVHRNDSAVIEPGPTVTGELLTAQDMREAEQRAIAAGTPALTLMERAGAAVAESCMSFATNRARRVAVLCGPGNNGGDGYVVARLLDQAGWQVRCVTLVDASQLAGDALASAQRWQGRTLSSAEFDGTECSLIVDALFGIGLSRALSGVAQDLVQSANASGVPIVSVDIPSGIDSDSGAELGEPIRAAASVTFARPKPGHYLYPGMARRGRLIVADIGIDAFIAPTSRASLRLNLPEYWDHGFPWPKTDGHKYKRGHAVVLSGGLSHTGAARLSARAALRVGAGLVTVASPGDALSVNASHLTAIMVRRSDGPEGLADILSDTRKNAVVLGPGLGTGPDTRALVETALGTPAAGSECGIVLDADALTSFEGDARSLATLIANSSGSVVITPHDGEFGRLFAAEAPVLDATSKIDRARAAAALLGCVVLLKGADTVVADAAGHATVAAEAAPWLATAGSGDVLSGLIGGLLAQGVPPHSAASMAAYLHVSAGRRFGPGLIAEDLPEAIPAALHDLQARGLINPG